MTLTEEQLEAIRDVSDLPRAIGCTQCHSYIQEHYGNQFAILRVMIDSSDHIVEPDELIGFDLEKVREAVHTLENFAFASGKITAGQIQDVLWGARLLAASAAEIERLRAEMDNYGDDFVCQMKSKDARIKEIESLLDEAEALTKKNADLMNIYLARIAELEDALVEGLTNFLHYRASCYDPARRCPYAKECDDCSTWDACGHVEKFRSEARQLLQAEGKIGPGTVAPPCWQITEERKAVILHCKRMLTFLKEDDALCYDVEKITKDESVLVAMLEDAK